jgi:GxxExxY protein
MTSNLIHSEITQKIIGCAMQVHSNFGLGFSEIIYKRSLIIELGKTGLNCRSEFEKDIYYKNQFIGRRRLDLIVEDKILVELKAISELEKNCYNQIINYLNIFEFEVGLLMNFGTESLQFKRFVNSSRKAKSEKS